KPSEHIPQLVIHSAVYGNLTGETPKTVDLTAKLSELVDNGSLTAQINNGFAGGDPIVGQVKQCRVDYSLDGVRKSVTVAENETLAIGKAVEGKPQPFTLRADTNGKMFVSATAPGIVNATLAS